MYMEDAALVYGKIIDCLAEMTDSLVSQINLQEPRNVIQLLIEMEIITDETLYKLRKEYVLHKRDERLKIMSEWLSEDSVLWELLRKGSV